MRCVVTRVPRNMSADNNRQPVPISQGLGPNRRRELQHCHKEYPEISPQFALC